MSPTLAMLLWNYRKELLAVAGGLLALLLAMGAAVTGAFVSGVPLVPDRLLPIYQRVAHNLTAPDGTPIGISWQALVTLDAVRYGQDFARVSEASIQELADRFIRTVSDPGGEPCSFKDGVWCRCWEETEKEPPELICVTEPMEWYEPFGVDEVADMLGFSEEQKRQLTFLAPVDLRLTCEYFAPNPASRYVWPVEGRLTSCFGPREDPFTGEPTFHYGIDIAAAEGMPVMAATDGVVHLADWAGEYGNLVVLVGDGGVHTWYGHLSGFAVAVGQEVARGAVIGIVGDTGRSTGVHLHFEVRVEGEPRNPVEWWE